MFEVIKSEYGKELGAFEFDYLGEHPSLDVVRKRLRRKVKIITWWRITIFGFVIDKLFITYGYPL
ncbi:MAG: hypothetical protein ACOY9Y_11490 [Bacillota bacterium]